MTERREDGLRTPDYWKNRAEEARAKASEMRDPTARGVMQDIAHKYDLLAEQAERMQAMKR